MTRYSIDPSVNQIDPKDESAPKDLLFPHMTQKKQVSPTRIFQTRRTPHRGSQSPLLRGCPGPCSMAGSVPGLSLLDASTRLRQQRPECLRPLPNAHRAGRGGGGQNGPCGESPVLPLPQKVCCFPVTGEKTPGTRNRKELSCSRSLRAGSPPPLPGAPPA